MNWLWFLNRSLGSGRRNISSLCTRNRAPKQICCLIWIYEKIDGRILGRFQDRGVKKFPELIRFALPNLWFSLIYYVPLSRVGGWFFDFSSPFSFLLIEFHCTFSIIKYFNIIFIIIVFVLGSDNLVFLFILCFPRDQSRDVTPPLGVSVILEWFFISRSCIFPATVITTESVIMGVLRP